MCRLFLFDFPLSISDSLFSLTLFVLFSSEWKERKKEIKKERKNERTKDENEITLQIEGRKISSWQMQ